MIIEAANAQGRPVPESAVPPPLDSNLVQYIGYFWELHSTRPMTMAGPGPIPWNLMREYAVYLGRDQYEDLFEDFMTYMSALDAEYIKVIKEEMDRKQKAAEAKANTTGRR